MLHVLDDPRYTVPPAVGSSAFRETQRRMARWLDGPAHDAARRHAVAALSAIDVVWSREKAEQLTRSLSDSTSRHELALIVPVALLADALGFSEPLECAHRQPTISAALLTLTTPVPPEAERSLVAQLEASGRQDPDDAANVVALLHQCRVATAALIEGADPPVRSTARISPDGERVDIRLDDSPFGRGPHTCPARALALALALGVRSGF